MFTLLIIINGHDLHVVVQFTMSVYKYFSQMATTDGDAALVMCGTLSMGP